MLDSLIAPPVPAVILLLGALGLAIVVPRISTRGSARRRFHEYAAAGVVGLALLSLLGLRVTYGRDSRGEGLELLSGWNFSTTESVAALVVRADALSLAFLVLILLVLLAVTLLRPVSTTAYDDKETVSRQSAWLLMGRVPACFLFRVMD